jgi:hypothetical protein
VIAYANPDTNLVLSSKVTNVEGIVKQWINDSRFDGDVAFQFTCPVTRKPASVLKDQGTRIHFFVLHSNPH